MKKQQIRKSGVRALNEELQNLYGFSFDKKATLEEGFDTYRIVMKEGTPVFFYIDDIPIPTLKKCIEECLLKKVVVDMGAVKFVTSGADIMRPGIVDVDEEIQERDIVAVVDQNNEKPLAIARAIFSGKEIKEMEKGKVLENIHYVGDKIWNLG